MTGPLGALRALGATRLDLLGFRAEDIPVVLTWRDAVLADPADAARVEGLAEALRSGIGRWFTVLEDPSPFTDEDAHHRLGRGVLPLCALLATAGDVHAAHLTRGIPAAVSWASLADLGLHVRKDQQVNGSTGLHNQEWLRTVWAGGFVRLGRLQLELTRSGMGSSATGSAREVVLGVHIPGDGRCRRRPSTSPSPRPDPSSPATTPR